MKYARDQPEIERLLCAGKGDDIKSRLQMTRHWRDTDLHQLARDRKQTERELTRAESGEELCRIRNRIEMIDRLIERTRADA